MRRPRASWFHHDLSRGEQGELRAGCPTAATPSANKYPKASPWVGWIAFAAVCMVVLGSFHVMQGVIALVDSDYFPVAGDGARSPA